MIGEVIKKVYADPDFWEVLINDSPSQSGPFDGSCLVCARALITVYPSGELVRITSNLNNGQTEHYGAMINGAIYDFDGEAANADEWMSRFQRNEQINDRDLSFSLGYDRNTNTPDNPDTVNKVTRIIERHLQYSND